MCCEIWNTQKNIVYMSLRGKTLVRPVRQAELTHTSPIGGQFVAWWALAAVAAWYVDTVGITLTQIVPTVTLIDIYARGRKREKVDISHRLSNCLVRADCQLVDSRRDTTMLFWLCHSSAICLQVLDDRRSWQLLSFRATIQRHNSCGNGSINWAEWRTC